MSGTSLMVMAWCCSMRKCMMWWLIANQWSSGEEAPPGQMQTGHRLWLSSALLYKFTQDPQRLSNSLYFVFSSVLCTSSWFLDIWIFHPTLTQLMWTMEGSVSRYQMRAPLISFMLSRTNHERNCTHFSPLKQPKQYNCFTDDFPRNTSLCHQTLLVVNSPQITMITNQPIKSVYRCE